MYVLAFQRKTTTLVGRATLATVLFWDLDAGGLLVFRSGRPEVKQVADRRSRLLCV